MFVGRVTTTAIALTAGLVGWLLVELTDQASGGGQTTGGWTARAVAFAVPTVLAWIAVRASQRTAHLEERVRASEARWRAILESAVDGMIIIDGRGRIEVFNPAAERMFGYAADDVIGRNVSVLMPSPHREAHDGYIAQYIATGQAHIIGLGREVTALRRDGTTFPVHLSVGEITGGGERRFTGILHDLSQRVRIEGQLREQAALARLGEMAAVIAHEVKNPLAGVRGAIEVIGGRLAADSPDREIVQEIVERIDRLNELMTDLLLFAKPPRARAAPVDLISLLTRTAALLSRDPVLSGVAVEIEGSAPAIHADAEMLKIVFQNLLVNAAQAMQGRGTIHVRVTPADGVARIAIIDHGPGIPADVRAKIFTPFFTTKSRGTGLGLPTAKQFIDAHHGRLELEPGPSGGTAVTVELPT